MKQFFLYSFLFLLVSVKGFSQDTDLQLAKQYAANGEQQKAIDLYQKLYRQDNDTYYNDYVNTLLAFKRFDEAIGITKKMIRKNPSDRQYIIILGAAYTQQGNVDKANELYDQLIANLPADQNEISLVASQFYRGANVDYAIKIFKQGRKLLHNDQLFTYELINLYRYKRDKAEIVDE